MRTHQIMTRNVITIGPDATIGEAAKTMLQHHIGGLPVVASDKLLGIISGGDLLRRAEIGTTTKHNRWISFFLGSGKLAREFVHERGRKVKEVMTPNPVTVSESANLDEVVRLMEKTRIQRLPVVKGDAVVGIVTRTDLLRALATLSEDVPDPTADDEHIRDRVLRAIQKYEWAPLKLGVTVRNGNVHLFGIVTDDRHREAAIVAAENISGVKAVYDQIAWLEPISGAYVPAEDEKPQQKSVVS